MSSHKILLGEDDIDDQEVMLEIFSGIDPLIELHSVNHGKKVVEFLTNLADNELPCIIVLDYNMPGLNGADILLQLKDHHRFDNIPKIIWSTSGGSKYRELCLDAGASDYVVKPSNINDLRSVAEYMLSFCK